MSCSNNYYGYCVLCLLLCRDMTENDAVVISSNGQLTLTTVSKDFEGTWKCQATNSYGNSEARTKLTVKPVTKGKHSKLCLVLLYMYLIQLNHCLPHDLIANTNLFQSTSLGHMLPCCMRITTWDLKLNMRLSNYCCILFH